jgi:hypothetical protein
MEETRHEIPRIRQDRDYPAGRAIALAGPTDWKGSAFQDRRFTAGMIGIGVADRKLSPIAPHGRIGFGTASRRLSAVDCRPGAGSTRTQPAGAGGALYGRETVFCLRGFGLSALESARSYHQPGLHRHQSGRGIRPRRPTSSGRPTSPISRLRGGAGTISPPYWDDFSRFIVAWKLCATRKAQDVTATLDLRWRLQGSIR